MPGSPFTLGVTVYDTDGSTALSSVTVTIRNENTNETQSDDTDSNGQVAFNLAGFTSGWKPGDIISYYVIYSGYEASGSFTSTDTGGTTKTLTLSSVPTAPSLKYFTVQEFLEYFQLVTYDSDNENGIKPETVIRVGEGVESEIDEMLYRTFDDNNGDYYTVTQELHNAQGDPSKWPGDNPNISAQAVYFTKYKPIVSLTTFQVNLNGQNQEANWSTLTEDNNQITLKKGIGRIEIVDSSKYPAAGRDQVRITYTHGMSSVPKDIKRLAILKTGEAFGSGQLQRLHIDITEAKALQDITNASHRREIERIMTNRGMPPLRGL